MPRETGFAAGATGLPAQEMSVLDPNQAPYMQGYTQGEPIGYAGMAAPFAAPAAVATAKALAPKLGQVTENYMVKQGMIQPLNVYHGTRHDIVGPLNTTKVGSEGGANYGYGLYTAEHPAVAQTFGKNLYKFDIPDENIEKMISWDLPFSEQTKHVQKVLKEIDPTISTNLTGREIYQKFSKGINLDKNPQIERILKDNPEFNVPAAASYYLNANDIKGIKYENFQAQKGKGFGTNNYVVFEPSDVKILEKNNKPVTRKELIQEQINKIE
jgi:hypothetical protein